MDFVLGGVATVFGVALAANVGRMAESLAGINRRFPWWMKSPVADYAVANRVTGAAIAVFGVALIWLGARGGG